jgi:hypothetical protein
MYLQENLSINNRFIELLKNYVRYFLSEPKEVLNTIIERWKNDIEHPGC